MCSHCSSCLRCTTIEVQMPRMDAAKRRIAVSGKMLVELAEDSGKSGLSISAFRALIVPPAVVGPVIERLSLGSAQADDAVMVVAGMEQGLRTGIIWSWSRSGL